MMELTTDLMLRAYAAGIFPMAESAAGTDLFWFDPETRGILPLEEFYVPRRLRKTVRKSPYRITCDTGFAEVVKGCASPRASSDQTWINHEIRRVYTRLFVEGYGHSVEAWDEDGELVGGLYGVAIGGAFFGESMFTRKRDASKVCLVHLVARLRAGGFTLLDTQFVTDHLRQFGAIEVTRQVYRKRLSNALLKRGHFYSPEDASGELALLGRGRGESSPELVDRFLQSLTQTS
ncbi:MAG: leucyl/phenylalanyl-tRNA--protein transferase [Alphaproteobacteria bacterium]